MNQFNNDTILSYSNMNAMSYPYHHPYTAAPQGYYYFQQPAQFQAPPKMMEPITPTGDCVLMGRGGKNNMHIGNEKLREMARTKAAEYKVADKKKKSEISLALVHQVHANGGRFLKRDPVTMQWHVVPIELSREKASQCCRDAVSNKNRRSSASSTMSTSTQTSTSSNNSNTLPEQIPSSTVLEPKRKESPIIMDMTAGNKRRRVEDFEPLPAFEKDESTGRQDISILADPAVLASLLANESAHSQSSKRANLFDELPETTLDFELFDCDSLVSDESLSEEFQL